MIRCYPGQFEGTNADEKNRRPEVKSGGQDRERTNEHIGNIRRSDLQEASSPV